MQTIINVAALTALARTLDKQAKAARDDLEPGEYEVRERVTLDVSGIVKVFEDHQYQPTTHIPLKVALALFVRYSGAVGQNAMNALVRAMREALEIESLPRQERKATVEAIRELADLEAAEATVRTGLAELPPQNRRGRITVAALVEPVGEAN